MTAMQGTRRGLFGILTLAALTAAIACSEPAPESTPSPAAHLVERARPSMGTELRLSAWTADESTAISAFDEVFSEFDRLESLMSNWIEDSDVSRLNVAAGERPVPVSAEVRDVLHIAHDVSEWTNGTFDITFGALAGLWKFDYQNKDDTIPPAAEVRKRLPLIDYQALDVDDEAGTAFVKKKGVTVNLGGIGKGYAIDRGVAILRRRGVRDFMIQAGGDLYVGGMRGDRPWRLSIRDPRGPAYRSFAAIELSNATFSTSGDYERFFMKDGRRYHHIMDVRTGEPAQGCRSVTLVSERAVLADALAKGVFVLGPTAGMELIERLPNVEGVIVSAKNEVLISSGLKDQLTMLAPPTDAP